VLEAAHPQVLAMIDPCHIRRIEGGILAYGADMWLDTNLGGEPVDGVERQVLRHVPCEGLNYGSDVRDLRNLHAELGNPRRLARA
jgi:hypothetical protein